MLAQSPNLPHLDTRRERRSEAFYALLASYGSESRACAALPLSVLMGLRRLNEQTKRLQRTDRNVLIDQVAVGHERQSFYYRLGFVN